jgi:hypothetical protein
MRSLSIYGIASKTLLCCVSIDLTPEEIEELVHDETGLDDWKIDPDKTFKPSKENPISCMEFPGLRKHYLLTR